MITFVNSTLSKSNSAANYSLTVMPNIQSYCKTVQRHHSKDDCVLVSWVHKVYIKHLFGCQDFLVDPHGKFKCFEKHKKLVFQNETSIKTSLKGKAATLKMPLVGGLSLPIHLANQDFKRKLKPKRPKEKAFLPLSPIKINHTVKVQLLNFGTHSIITIMLSHNIFTNISNKSLKTESFLKTLSNAYHLLGLISSNPISKLQSVNPYCLNDWNT